MMKSFNGNSVYSKTYAQPNGQPKGQTLIVDNVRYRLAKNKKSMIKVGNGVGNGSGLVNGSTAAKPSSRFNLVNKPNRTLKTNLTTPTRLITNNYQFVSRKSFKLVNRSKSKLILKKPNRFKFNRLNSSASGSISSKRPPDLYKKTYNNSVPKNQDQQFKIQIAQQLRKKALRSIICLNKKNGKLKKNNKLKLCTDNTIYCMFFCRFGKCAKIETCKYKHDKDKVAVCKKLVVFI